MTRSLFDNARRALIDERRDLTHDELTSFSQLPVESIPTIAALAHEVRLERCGPTVEVEGILSAKTGGCPEDCHFCSQSSQFESPVRPTAILDLNEIRAAALETARMGASEFCIVAAVRGPDDRLIDRVLEATDLVRKETGLNVAASLGILTRDQAYTLAKGGVHRYNHNLETSRSFFPSIVSTHSWEERFDTCLLVRETGMELCCGMLLGMGESDEQRVEMLLDLREVTPAEVPLNFLNPRPGTPLGDRPLVQPLEAIRWISLFRLALPEVILRYAGGREVTLRELQSLGLTAGINALIVGNYLTTLGRNPSDDIQMLEDLRMPIGALSKVI
ncbi:MAG TPA: biotin synthase BioB [Actinomycetota bacterium]|nr:biotin synthase BioB [Actinomycetota bacterium]